MLKYSFSNNSKNLENTSSLSNSFPNSFFNEVAKFSKEPGKYVWFILIPIPIKSFFIILPTATVSVSIPAIFLPFKITSFGFFI